MAGDPNHLDLQPIADAIKAAILAQMSGRAAVYDTDDIPGAVGGRAPGEKPPAKHVEISFNRVDASPSRRGSGVVSIPDLELATRCHAKSIADVRELRRRVGLALEDQAYDLPEGGTVGPFVFAIGEPEDDDDFGWVGTDHWTFA